MSEANEAPARRPTPHADAAVSALRTAATAHHAALQAGTRALAAGFKQLAASIDVLDVMAALAETIVAAEDLRDINDALAKSARVQLARTMSEVGAHTIATSNHVASLRQPPNTLLITDPAAIPPHYLTTPQPAPDRAAITKELRSGRAVPGCVISNGGEPTLQIRGRT